MIILLIKILKLDMNNIESHKDMAYKIAWKYINSYYGEKEDIMQEALLALVEASKKFDKSKNTKFSTYAWKYIDCKIKKYIKKQKKIMIEEDEGFCEDQTEQINNTLLLNEILCLLNEKEKELLLMRYDLKNNKVNSYENIAKKTKTTKQNIFQKEKRIIKKLKKNKKLMLFVDQIF